MLYWYIVFCAGWSIGALLSHMTIGPKSLDAHLRELFAVGVFAFGIYLQQAA